MNIEKLEGVETMAKRKGKRRKRTRNKARKSVLTNKLLKEVRLLRRHILMLKTIKKYQPIGIIRLSEKLDLPQHKIRYSLRLLEQDGLIKPSSEGAVVTKKMTSFLPHLRETLNEMTNAIRSIRRSIK